MLTGLALRACEDASLECQHIIRGLTRAITISRRSIINMATKKGGKKAGATKGGAKKSPKKSGKRTRTGGPRKK